MDRSALQRRQTVPAAAPARQLKGHCEVAVALRDRWNRPAFIRPALGLPDHRADLSKAASDVPLVAIHDRPRLALCTTLFPLRR